MKGYVAQKGKRYYAVIYEGIDPVTGRERRSWHAAGADRADAERLAARLASDRQGVNDEVRSLSFGAYLTSRWLPGKRVVLAATTYNGYRRNVENHIVPALGRIGLRRLRPHHLEALYDRLLHPSDGSAALAPKTVYEIHLVIRGALADAARRGLVTRNVALVAHAPRLRSIPTIEQKAWTGEELQMFLRAPPVTGCSPRSGCRPSPGCVATSCLGSAGTTSTRRPQPSRSTAGSLRSVTSCTRRVAKLQQRGAASTSTRQP